MLDFNLDEIQKRATEIQKNIKERQEEMMGKVYQGDAGGGAVVVKVQGRQVIEVFVDKSLVDQDDLDSMTDLIKHATNMALKKSDEDSASGFSDMMKDFNLGDPLLADGQSDGSGN